MLSFPQLRLYEGNNSYDNNTVFSVLFSARSAPTICTEKPLPIYSLSTLYWAMIRSLVPVPQVQHHKLMIGFYAPINREQTDTQIIHCQQFYKVKFQLQAILGFIICYSGQQQIVVRNKKEK